MQRRKPVDLPAEPLQVVFDPTPEIYATDSGGSFSFPLLVAGRAELDTADFDEARFLFSIWHPSSRRVIAHRPATIALADRVAVLEGGRIVEEGAHEELLAHSLRYRTLLALEEAAA